MVTNLSMESRRNLDAAGFSVSRRGFDRKELPLYAHKKTIGVKVGDVQLRVRLEHPNQLNEYESSYLSRKASQGMMPWLPGEDCLRRDLKTFEISKPHPLTGQVKAKVTGTSKGCEWCRAKQESQGEAERAGENSEIEPSFSQVLSSSPVATFSCDHCTFVADEEDKSGRARTEGQRRNSINAHMRFKHKDLPDDESIV